LWLLTSANAVSAVTLSKVYIDTILFGVVVAQSSPMVAENISVAVPVISTTSLI
jgi:hypothetical protein